MLKPRLARFLNLKFPPQIFHRPNEPVPEVDVETNYIDGGPDELPIELFEPDNKEEEEFYVGGVTTEMLEMEVTTLLPTTTTVETTTIPIRKCCPETRSN